MPSKICKACSHQNHFRSTKCKSCNAPLAKSPGRTLGTTAAQGYNVGRSGGRPRDTSATEGYGVSPGRSSGTSAAKGSNVGRQGGRPTGTSAAEGSNVGRAGGRPTGTSAAEGSNVGRAGGRPTGTSAAQGYGVSTGWPSGTSGGKGKHGKSITFLDDIDLPTEWDTSHVNLDADLLSQCRARIMQQRTFDRKSLGVGVCYNCGTSIQFFQISFLNLFFILGSICFSSDEINFVYFLISSKNLLCMPLTGEYKIGI